MTTVKYRINKLKDAWCKSCDTLHENYLSHVDFVGHVMLINELNIDIDKVNYKLIELKSNCNLKNKIYCYQDFNKGIILKIKFLDLLNSDLLKLDYNKNIYLTYLQFHFVSTDKKHTMFVENIFAVKAKILNEKKDIFLDIYSILKNGDLIYIYSLELDTIKLDSDIESNLLIIKKWIFKGKIEKK